jgi:CHAD domain-containing protein
VTSRANGGPGLPAKRKSKTPDKPVKIRWEGHKSVAENAREKLPELAREFFEAGSELGADASFKALHRFRLLAKRFRYTLELFRPCYGPGLDRRIEALRTLQQYLGEINDCATTRALLLARDNIPRAERDRLAGQVAELAGSRIAKFHRHWQSDFARARRENWWTGYLVRFAGRGRR